MVRKLLAENGISETEVTGTGSGGRITRDDAQRVVEARRARGPTACTGPRRRRPTCRPTRPGSACRTRGPGAPGAVGLHGVVPGRR